MTIAPGRRIPPGSPEPLPAHTEVAMVPERMYPDTYQLLTFTESSYPSLAEAAQRVHAEGYAKEGFVYPEAIMDDGRLPADIDKARGPNVEYYLAVSPAEKRRDHLADPRRDRATMRKVHLAPGETFTDLPAYALCGETLSPMGRDLLANLEHADVRLKEISALARTEMANPMAVHEIFRHAIQEAMGKDEVWFFSIVSTTYESLAKSFGRDNFTVIGEDVAIPDARVNPDVRLRPTVLHPDEFIDNILNAYQAAEDGPDKHRLLRSFLYFTDGLEPSRMSPTVAAARDEILASRSTRDPRSANGSVGVGATESGTVYANRLDALLAGRKYEHEEWVPPTEFDLSIDVDRRLLEKQFDFGNVSSVFDAVSDIAGDLFEIRHPDRKGDAELRARFIEEITAQGSAYGRWFLFPSGQLVRYPTEQDYVDIRTVRNRNLITATEQAALRDKSIAVFGLSVGSSVVRSLVMSAIGNKWIFGDADEISGSNLNRLSAGFAAVGSSKLDHVAAQISALDPYIRQVHFREGFHAEDAEALAAARPDIIFDEVDDIAAKVALRQYAQKAGIPVVMVTDVGDRTIVDVERHDQGRTALFGGRLGRKLLGRIASGQASEADILAAKRKIVGLRHISDRLAQSAIAAEIDHTLPGMPQLGTTATQGGAAAAVAAREILLGRRLPTGRYVIPMEKLLDLEPSISKRITLSSLWRLVTGSRSKQAA